MRRDEGGQMMLLSAVLMIFAFLALSAMVSRVSQLGSVTTQDHGRPVLLEIDVVQATVDETVTGLKAVSGFCAAALPSPDQCKGPFKDALDGSLAHLAALEAGRGFDLSWGVVDAAGTDVTACVAAPSPARYVEFALDDGEVRITLRSTVSFTWAC